MNDLPKYAKDLTFKQGALRAEEMVDFEALFRSVVGHPPPAVLYFAQGAQFAGVRAFGLAPLAGGTPCHHAARSLRDQHV